MTYYRKGSNENYIDRKYSSQVGLYTQTVSEQYYPYIHPQETSNKTDVRFLELLSDKLKLIEASYVFFSNQSTVFFK
jgi:beta-galactosidase